MNIFTILVVAVGLIAAEPTKEPTIQQVTEAVVQEQLDAYNDADLERFVATFSEDMVAVKYPGEILFSGHEGLRKSYGDFFKDSPNHEVFIKTRTVQGNKVIDVELYSKTGKREDVRPGFYVAIYTVENGKITRMEFVNPK
ncbi:MAG: nuclear transport factor 2 family protein [Kordiimonadaceae bacterium]|nr:nuclear transport factor 2 family protein [Kordiimonadaceae bacterium]